MNHDGVMDIEDGNIINLFQDFVETTVWALRLGRFNDRLGIPATRVKFLLRLPRQILDLIKARITSTFVDCREDIIRVEFAPVPF